MALPTSKIQRYPTPDEVLQTLLSAVAFAYNKAGLDVNVSVGSELYFRYRALAQFVSVAVANGKLGLRDIDPREVTGDALVRWAGAFGVFKRDAEPSTGAVIVETVLLSGGLTPTYATGTIPSLFRCTGPGGVEYEVIAATLVTNGSSVDVRAVEEGAGGDAVEGTVLGWNDATLSFLKPDCTVAPGGIVDGIDADDEEDLRRNLLRRLANPAGGGNPAQVQQTALNSSAAIQDVFTHPAVLGAASDSVTLVSGSGDRTVGAATIARAAAALASEMPGSIRYTVETVNPQGVDIIVDIATPLPESQGGEGGGFTGIAPWPSDAESGIKALVTAKATSPVSVTVNSTSADPPKPGDRFGLWDNTYVNSGEDDNGNDLTGKLGIMREFTIQSMSGSSGAYTLLLDTSDSSALDFVTANESYCSVSMVNLIAYARAFMLAMYGLGPGEKTDNQDILPFGRRNPGPGIDSPIALTTLMLRNIAEGNSEVLDMAYAARYAAGTTTALTSPSLPSSTAAPSRILTLNDLSFRRLTL